MTAAKVQGAERFVPARPSLPKLRSAVQECRGCELYRDATQAVMGEGGRAAELMMVGEQPGDREDVAGRPFVGPAGKLLDQAMEAAEIDPADVFRTNAVKHFRFTLRGKRRIHSPPDLSHLVACRPWLSAELSVVRPRGVVVLGASAGKSIYGGKFTISARRGELLSWPDQDGAAAPEWVVATIHPSAVLRSRDRDELFAGLVADLELAARTLAQR